MPAGIDWHTIASEMHHKMHVYFKLSSCLFLYLTMSFKMRLAQYGKKDDNDEDDDHDDDVDDDDRKQEVA